MMIRMNCHRTVTWRNCSIHTGIDSSITRDSNWCYGSCGSNSSGSSSSSSSARCRGCGGGVCSESSHQAKHDHAKCCWS